MIRIKKLTSLNLWLLLLCSSLIFSQSCGRTFTGTSGSIYTGEDGGLPLTGPDLDEDGSIDIIDNCPNIYNPNQLDTNFDGQGDACTVSEEISEPALSIMANGNSSITLSWTQNNTNVSAYKVKRKINDNSYVELAELSSGTHEYQDSNLISNQRYVYKVEVHKDDQVRVSNYVVVDVSSTGSLLFLPETVSGISVEFIEIDGECRPKFKWYDNSDNETYFYLYGQVASTAGFNWVYDDIEYQMDVDTETSSTTGWRSYIHIGNFPLYSETMNSVHMDVYVCNDDGCSDSGQTLYVPDGQCQ